MSAWDDRNGGASPVAGSSGVRQFNNGGVGLPSGVGAVYRPTPAGSTPPALPGDDEEKARRLGVVSINPLNPAETSLDPISQLFDGLRQGLVGGNDDTPGGQSSRQNSLIGGIPIVGDAGRAVANAVGGLGEVFGGATAAVGGALERIPASTSGSQQLEGAYEKARQEALATENGRKLWEETQAAIDKEKGLFGTGLLDDDLHLKSAFIRKWEEEKQYDSPSLLPGAFTVPGSLSDTVANLFDTLEGGAAVVAKQWAQLDTPGQGGMDRIDAILAVGDGETNFNEDKGILKTGILAGDPTTGLNAMEQLVYSKVRNGDWSRDQAADFLASNGQAFGHSALVNVGGAVALDPLNIATVGAGTAAKVGARGALMTSRLSKAKETMASVGRAVEEAQAAVKAARVGGSGAENLSAAKKALRLAEADYETAKVSAQALTAYRSGGSIRGINVLARASEGSEKVGTAFRLAGRPYSALEGTSIGRAAKLTRTIIDPLHAVDLRMPGSARMVDLYSDALPRSVVDTLGVQHYKGMLDDALRLDNSRGMYDQLSKDIGVASANLGREGIINMFRANQLAGNLGEELMKTLPEDVFETAVATTKQRDLEKWLRYNAVRNVQIDQWDDISHQTLARGLEQAYNTRTADEWLEAFKTMSKEQKSLYKFAVYGNANRRLLDFTGNMSPETAAKLSFPPGRMVLLAKNTLTRVGGESLLTKLTKLKTTKARIALITEWQARYPSLRYISIDPAARERSVDRFIMNLEQNLDRLPMQMTKDELAALGEDGDQLDIIAGEYSLGFAPEDRFRWGLERDAATGLYSPAGEAWADHVADGAIPYRPAAALRTNIMGHPLPDIKVARAAVRAIDHLDSAARIMRTQVTGAMVTEAARKRFVALSVSELGERGVTEAVAQSWFERITEYTRAHQGYSGPRGVGGDDLYRAIKEKQLIPQALLSGDKALSPPDVLMLVLRAYDGDMRYIGLTQKLSSRIKTMMSLGGTNNFAGQIAEHAWPTLKFRLNPIFQLQEKIEPWVLNAQRGVSFATGVNLSAADRATEELLTKMTDFSLVRQADIDQFEYSSAVLFAASSNKTAALSGSRLSAIRRLGHTLGDVQGVKRINMLRTFRKGLGSELRRSWDEARPGDWDKMKEAADIRAGRILDDDDFALQLVAENAYANDVFVSRVLDKSGKFKTVADFGNAVKTGAWHTPTTLGELKALDLEHMAKSLRITNAAGDEITDLNGLRQALVTEPDVMDKVVDGLTQLGADPDYIRRTRNALDFSWKGFWQTAEKRFALTADESVNLQNMMAEAAKLRDMTPVEFMSQVFSPSLIDGTEGVLGHIEGTVRILRDARAAGRRIKPREAKIAEYRTRIAGKEGVSTREDLVRQLSQTFSAHLDPSAKRALLLEFRPELHKAVLDGKVRLDLNEVQSLWDDAAENDLADRILGYMDGKSPTHAADELDDTRGVVALREASTRYMRERGVEPLQGRLHFKRDAEMDAHYEQGAAHFRDLPDIEVEKTGRIPTARTLSRSSTELKPKPAAVDDRTYEAYQAFVIDTRSQFDYLTRPTAKGGLGLKVVVSRTDPYTADAAGRAAMVKDIERGTLKVFGGASDHSLMTNEQNVMFRAVHDVFGHAAEGFEFGPRGELNAAAKHARMYSNEGRPAMLTEAHGQTAYVNYSDDIYSPPGVEPKPLDPASPAKDFESRYPFDPPAVRANAFGPDDIREGMVTLEGKDPYGIPRKLDYTYTERIGPGLKAMDPELQAAILQPIADLFDEFPNLRVHHIEAVSFSEPLALSDETGELLGGGQGGAFAITWGADADEPVIIFNTDLITKRFESEFTAHNEVTRQNKSFASTGGTIGPRKTNMGVPHNAGRLDIAQVARHEAGHAFDVARRPHKAQKRLDGTIATSRDGGLIWEQSPRTVDNEAYHKMMTRFERAAGRLDLSEYGMTNSAEFAAELFSFATNPKLVVADIASSELREMVQEFRQFLIDSGEWVPVLQAPNPLAGKTIREVNAISRGTVYAPQKAGLLPQEYLDEFTDRFVGRSKHIESNPDIARTAQMFGKWSEAVVRNGLLRGEKGIYSDLLNDIAGLPTGQATPYNYTEAATVNLAMSNMTRKWDDAFRLQYFSQERSFFERSLNHPMFGMYPASYMWGKIMPELVRGIATNPFGNRTGGALYSLMDVQANIAMRREFDAEFDANIEQMGRSQALSFLGYMLPTLPWDVAASAPAWMKSIARQGSLNAETPEGGEPVSLLDPAVESLKRLVPLTTTLPWAGRAIDEVNGPENEAESVKDEQDQDKLVRAAELGPTMQRVIQELQEALR